MEEYEPYCIECGADYEDLAYVNRYADSRWWECNICGHEFSVYVGCVKPDPLTDIEIDEVPF